MKIKQEYNKNFGKWFINDVLRAIKKYSLIEPGEKICVALSGGKDSLTLLYILWYINRYSHLKFELSAIHIITNNYDISLLQNICQQLDIPLFTEHLRLEKVENNKNICYICSRLKRGAIASVLKKNNINKIAYGHHADDATETFFMNMIQNKKLGSFSPKVKIPGSEMIIIRPMIYLTETLISSIHRYVTLSTIDFICEYEKINIRSNYKENIKQLNNMFNTRNFSKIVVNSLENIDKSNLWENLLNQN